MNNDYMEKENNNKLDKDGISLQLKKKIYDWLVDISIIKDKVIKIDSLPTLCINGVLLCDLINRCEGKNEILRGIIRRTSTRSQMQVNINKVLEYLRTLEKFPSRHLWDNHEISKGNNIVIWELLDDVYNFYGNKIKFNRKIKKNNNRNNLNRTFTQTKSNNKDKNNNFEYINTYSNTPLKGRKKNSLNIINNKYNNNINNEDSLFSNNQNNYPKYNFTPIINKKKKKKKKMSYNIINNNNNVNKNIFKIYEDNKINKREKINKTNKNIFDFNFNNKEIESSNRNNINHTNDNFYESKMFSIDNIDNVNLKDDTKSKKINKDNTYRKNFDVSSIYSDRFFNMEKSNKSFSVNNEFYNKRKNNRNAFNIGNNTRYII